MKSISLIGTTGAIGQEIFDNIYKKNNVYVDNFTRKNI